VIISQSLLVRVTGFVKRDGSKVAYKDEKNYLGATTCPSVQLRLGGKMGSISAIKKETGVIQDGKLGVGYHQCPGSGGGGPTNGRRKRGGNMQRENHLRRPNVKNLGVEEGGGLRVKKERYRKEANVSVPNLGG